MAFLRNMDFDCRKQPRIYAMLASQLVPTSGRIA